jgi:predicted nucleic acid-binding protein
VKTLVVDASVAAKWFFEEDQSASARRLFSSRRSLVAPELLGVELANVIWKRVQRKELDTNAAVDMLADFQRLAVEIIPSAPYLPAALELAILTGRTVYDCLYLSLAMNQKTQVVTADRRFAAALAGSSLAKHVRLLEKPR